jgi:hypothetical protein
VTTHRLLRARVLLGEAAALGVELADLIAAAPTGAGVTARVPILADHVEMIAATFTPGTARAYRSYWRLAVKRLGDQRLDDTTITDLQAVVDDAVHGARRNRPDSPRRVPASRLSPRMTTSTPCHGHSDRDQQTRPLPGAPATLMA